MANQRPIHVFINKTKYELDDAVQTGASLKWLANIKLEDVLFLQSRGDDEVVGNDAQVLPRRDPRTGRDQPARRSRSECFKFTTLEKRVALAPVFAPNLKVRRAANGITFSHSSALKGFRNSTSAASPKRPRSFSLTYRTTTFRNVR